MLDKKKFDSLYDDGITKKSYEDIISIINVRFSEIINLILPKNKKWFDFANDDYYENGWFDIHSFSDFIDIIGDIKLPSPYNQPKYNGVGFIPTKWLWTPNEEVLKEFAYNVEEEKKRKEDKRLKAKLKRVENTNKKKIIKLSIEKKLTQEELKYIKFK